MKPAVRLRTIERLHRNKTTDKVIYRRGGEELAKKAIKESKKLS